MSEEIEKQLKSAFAQAKDQERQRAEDFFTIYANNVAIGISSWDMSIVFGEIIGQRDDGKPVIEEIGKVIMSREFAKVVSQVLALNIAAYEKQFGEIEVRHFDLQPDAATMDFGVLKNEKPAPSKK